MNHWEGKCWHAYGTSMTSVKWGKYVPVVQALSGLQVVNHGIPGGSLTPDGIGNAVRGYVKKAVMDLTDGKLDADLITLEVLPNEGKLVGDIYDTDDESFCGCLNQCLRFLQENTKAQIVLILMVCSNARLPETPMENKGITVFEFAQKARQVAMLNSVPVIDAVCESGFGQTRTKNKAYQVDHIHLNELGGRNMGHFIWSKLKDIPLWETE